MTGKVSELLSGRGNIARYPRNTQFYVISSEYSSAASRYGMSRVDFSARWRTSITYVLELRRPPGARAERRAGATSPMRFVILHSPQDAAGALYLGDILSRHPRVGVASLTASNDAPRLSELWQEAAHPRNGSAYGDAPSAVGLLLPSDAFDQQPQLLHPLQQALAADGVVIRLGWHSAIGCAAHRLRADAGQSPVAWGGAPLSPSAAQLQAVLRREASADEALRRLAMRLASPPARQPQQHGGRGSGTGGGGGGGGSSGGSSGGGGGPAAPAVLRVDVEQLSSALNETVSGALRAVGLPAANGRWWSIEAAWMLDSWQRAAAHAGSGDGDHGGGGRGGGGEAAVASAAAEMSMQDYYTMLRALEAEDAAMEAGATARPSSLAPLLSRLDALPANTRGRAQRKVALLQHVLDSWCAATAATATTATTIASTTATRLSPTYFESRSQAGPLAAWRRRQAGRSAARRRLAATVRAACQPRHAMCRDAAPPRHGRRRGCWWRWRRQGRGRGRGQ